jgi:hypothetical protein
MSIITPYDFRAKYSLRECKVFIEADTPDMPSLEITTQTTLEECMQFVKRNSVSYTAIAKYSAIDGLEMTLANIGALYHNDNFAKCIAELIMIVKIMSVGTQVMISAIPVAKCNERKYPLILCRLPTCESAPMYYLNELGAYPEKVFCIHLANSFKSREFQDFAANSQVLPEMTITEFIV